MPTKLHRACPGLLMFQCPGCGIAHGVTVEEAGGAVYPSYWEWNGSMKEPTFAPSVLVTGSECHSHVKNGSIEFLADCSHGLAGKTVELPDWPCESCVQGRI